MLELRRQPGWRGRLDALISELRKEPFDWSKQHDCAFGLAAKAIHAITNVDVAVDFRGCYSTSAGALRCLRNKGYQDVCDLAASVLPEIHPSRAKIGDIAAYPKDSPFGYALGVVNGERVFVLMDDGIGTMGLLAAARMFKVG